MGLPKRAGTAMLHRRKFGRPAPDVVARNRDLN
jgi:hypothetical protein